MGIRDRIEGCRMNKACHSRPRLWQCFGKKITDVLCSARAIQGCKSGKIKSRTVADGPFEAAHFKRSLAVWPKA
jgi:hypothetical protein